MKLDSQKRLTQILGLFIIIPILVAVGWYNFAAPLIIPGKGTLRPEANWIVEAIFVWFGALIFDGIIFLFFTKNSATTKQNFSEQKKNI